MNKSVFLFLISLFSLQSCSINSEIVYHKNATSSSVTDIDMKQFISEMKAMTPDSLKNDNEFSDMNKFPSTWTSLYELEQKNKETKTTNPDHIKIMKKIFMKSNKENDQPTGLSLKTESLNQNDYQELINYTQKEKIPVEQNIFNLWDGKTLTIDTENFNLKYFEGAMSAKGSADSQSVASVMTTFLKGISTTLKFENKIKSITGKHDWLKQIDDYTIKIDYDIKAKYDRDAKLNNVDKKIIVVTE